MKHSITILFYGAESRTRTGTDLHPRDFKSLASTYSAIPAYLFLEAAPGFEPGIRVLQTRALPLGYAANVFPYFQSKTL